MNNATVPKEEPAAAQSPVADSPAAQTCDLVCQRAKVSRRPEDTADMTARAEADANAVIGTMHDDLLACYVSRLRTRPDAHAFLTFEVVIDATGKVRTVETSGGAMLGDATLGCMVERIRRGQFAPPAGGGTLRIHVPMAFRRTGVDA